MSATKPGVVLVILDGWGIAPPGPGNAIAQAQVPHFRQYWENFPHTQLAAAGSAVGLPAGADGNSEVGHLNLGAGRMVIQDVMRINQSIADGSFFANSAFLKAIDHVRKNQSQIHLLGLIGQGVVHASNNHLLALLELLTQEKINRVFLHLFTDGRDSPPQSAKNSLNVIEAAIQKRGVGQIASLSGRYFAMDRDQRWDRTEKMYQALTEGFGNRADSALSALEAAYKEGKTDEFILPTVIVKDNQPLTLIKDNDAVIFYNFRIDRPRQLTKAFVLPKLTSDLVKKRLHEEVSDLSDVKIAAQAREPFKRRIFLKNLCFVTMTEYEKDLPAVVAFPEMPMAQPLGEIISAAGLKQLRAAETEKERFVTYYFNGYREKAFPQEERLVVPSPAVATYDLQPEMSAYLLTDEFIRQLESQKFDLAVLNFANPDMVGHTGKLAATIKACEAVDECLGGIVEFVLGRNDTLLICADHGNAEEVIDQSTGEINTEHSTSDVPFILVDNRFKNSPLELPKGILGDVAPTLLSFFGIKPPEVMTGRSLISALEI